MAALEAHNILRLDISTVLYSCLLRSRTSILKERLDAKQPHGSHLLRRNCVSSCSQHLMVSQSEIAMVHTASLDHLL